MNKRWKAGVALLSLAIVAAAIILGVGFGTKRKSGDNGQAPVIFTVSFETNGGGEIASVSGEAGAVLNLPVPYKEGYEFDGWYTDGGFSQAAPNFMPAGNATYYAKYAKLYTVRFVTEGTSADFTGRAGTEISVPSPEREGAAFEGWYADPDCLKPVLPATVIAGDAVYYAKFSPLYTVRFETFGGEELPAVTGKAGDTFEVAEPQKPGFVFEGWYLDEAFAEEAAIREIPVGGAVFYAKFAPLYTVRFLSEYGELGYVTGKAGTEITVPDPARDGWEFEGWFSDETYSSAFIPPTEIPSCDLTIYAKYARLYTVSFETAGGTEIPAVTAKAGTPLTVSDPEKEGFSFLGWFTDGEFLHPAAICAVPESDTVYYAKFARIYTVSFFANGELYRIVTGIAGTPVAAPEPPYAAGSIFLGWADAEDDPETFPIIIGECDLVYSAAYGENPMLRFFSNAPAGVQVTGDMPAVEGVYGESVTVVLADHAYSAFGYRFAGWATEPHGNVVWRDGDTVTFSQDINLYAQWLRGYTCEELFGATVFYGDAVGAILVKDGEEIAAEVALNKLGEREFAAGELHGRLNEDGTFTLRAEEYGTYEIYGGGTMFLSGYGTAQYRNGRLTDTGVYTLSMGNLLYFGGSQTAGTYRVGDDRSTLFYVDNSAVSGQYYDSDFTAFLLGEQAVFGNERGVYVAHGDTISFYFGGEETQTQNFIAGQYFTYRDTVFYFVTGETVFACESARLVFTPNGSYPVEARLETDGEILTGMLEEDPSGERGGFVFTAESDRSFAQCRVRLRFGGGVGRLELLSGETRNVWLAEGAEADGSFLCFTKRFDSGRVAGDLRVNGKIVLQDGNVLTVPETDLDSDPVRSLEFEIGKNGVIYRLRCDLTDAEGRYFRFGWYGTKRTELVTADGSYKAVCEQFAGSENAEGYEGVGFGATLAFALFARETELDAEYSFTTAEGASFFHVFSGAYAGQYRLRFSRDGSGFLTGFVCDRYEIALCGDYVLALVGTQPVRMISLEERAELPLLEQMPVTATVLRLVYELPDGTKAEFAFGLDGLELMRAQTRRLTDGTFTAEVFAETEGGTVYSVRLSEGLNDLGDAVQTDGIWEIRSDYDRYEIVVFADNTGVEIRREKAVFLAESENGLAVAYTLCGEGEIEEICSVTEGGDPLVFDGVYDLEGGYYIRAHDEWDGRVYGCLLRFSSEQVSLEEVLEYGVGLGEGKISVLYTDDWFFLSPQLALYSRFLDGYRSFGGTVRRESESVFVWEPISRNGADVTFTVVRSANKLKPFTASAEGFPTAVCAENESGEIVAEVVFTLSEPGGLTVLAFTAENQDAAPEEDEILSLGEGKWYFASLGYLLTVCGEEKFLEACGESVTVSDGALSAEIVRAGFELLPVRLFFNGAELTGGTFAVREEGGFVWKRGGEVYTLIVTEEETGPKLQAFEGEPELFAVTFRYGNGGANGTVYAPRGEFQLSEPPAREGYVFVCWISGYDEYRAGDTFSLSRNTTFTAQWEPET